MSKLNLPRIEVQAKQGLSFEPPRSALQKWNPALHAEGDDDPGVITIYDIIGYEEFGGVSVKRIDRALRSIGDRDVLVRINSPGGDLFEGAAIYNRLREHKGKVTTQNIGLAASAASIIMEAGDVRQTARAAFTMIHNVWALAIGNRNDLREFADFLEPFDDMLADVYAARTGMEKKKVAKMMDAETWMNGSQTLENGFADELMSSDVSEDGERDKDKWKDAAALVRGVDAALLKGGVKREERVALMGALRTHLDSQQPGPEGSPTERSNNMTTENKPGTAAAGTETTLAAAPAAPQTPAASAAPTQDAIQEAIKADRQRGKDIMALPEAKGREGLAQACVEQGMSIEQSKAMLAAAPKASRLDTAMAGLGTPGIRSEDVPDEKPVATSSAQEIYARRQGIFTGRKAA